MSNSLSVAFTFRASVRAFPPSEPMLLSEHGADYQPNRTTKCKHKSIHILPMFNSVSVVFTFRALARAFPSSSFIPFPEHGADYQPNQTTKCKHKSIHKMKT